MFKKILIANRGEIALRIIRACRELGIGTVAIYSKADELSLHTRFADEAICVGPNESSKSYLNIPSILSAAELTDADAIHPGYGFLSENAKFSSICKENNIKFIGPDAETINLMGNKSLAKDTMKKVGVPTIPGSDGNVESYEDAKFICTNIGYPVIIKATSGHTFDYVVASHMIEHAPNLLLFLSEVHNILKPGGTCVLIIPDKRFTFDINRPVSTFGSVLESFLSKATYPSISAVYDHSAMAINANGHNLWHGIVNADDSRLLASENIGWEAAHRVHKEGHYYDVHVNIFTPESFCSILEKAISHEIVFFEVSKFVDTQVGQIEFMLQLKKSQNEANELVKSRCLASIPKFEIESILSPYMPQVKSLSNALEKVSETSVNQQKQLMELREQIGSQNKKIDELKDRLNLTQLVLDRRSVKLAVGLVDKFFSIIRKKSF